MLRLKTYIQRRDCDKVGRAIETVKAQHQGVVLAILGSQCGEESPSPWQAACLKRCNYYPVCCSPIKSLLKRVKRKFSSWPHLEWPSLWLISLMGKIDLDLCSSSNIYTFSHCFSSLIGRICGEVEDKQIHQTRFNTNPLDIKHNFKRQILIIIKHQLLATCGKYGEPNRM